MDKVAINIKQTSAVFRFVGKVIIPDLVVECTWFGHGAVSRIDEGLALSSALAGVVKSSEVCTFAAHQLLLLAGRPPKATGMKPIHILLGVVMAAMWGFNFVVLKVALHDVPPFLLTAIRFTLSCLPVFFLPRPRGLLLKPMVIVGLTTFLGQYVFLFAAMAHGMPAGLSSVTLQLQVFITIFLSVVVLGERPILRHYVGGTIAVAGLLSIAATVGSGTTIPALAMVLIVLAAASWAYGNITMRQAGPSGQFGTLAGVAWTNLVPIVPAFALSLTIEGPERIVTTFQNMSMLTVAALVFVVVCSTWLGFVIWGKLLATYASSTAAPFALLVPVFGALSAYIVLDETFSNMRLLGAALILVGLMVILLPVRDIWTGWVERN